MKLIPFGKHWLTHSPTNSVYLFIGKAAWEKAKNFQLSRPGTLCLPPPDSPYLYTWPIKDFDILIFDSSPYDDSYITNIVLCLYAHDAEMVRYVGKDFSLKLFKKDF